MAKLTAKEEGMLRNTAEMHRRCLDEVNKMLVAGGCEPEPETVIRGAHVVASGIIAKTTGFFSDIGKKITDGYNETKKAGEERLINKEIDSQVAEQLKDVKEKLHATVKTA